MRSLKAKLTPLFNHPLVNAKLRPFFVMVALILSSICLRFVHLGKQSLFLDEAWSWAATRLNFLDLVRLSLVDPHPPLYYILLKLFLEVIPGSEFGLRALSALLSITSLVIVMAYVKSRWNTETMFYVGLVMTVSSFDIYYSQETRMYTLLGLLMACSYIAIVKTLEGDRRFLIVWAITTIMMAWTHAYGVIVAFTYILFITGYLVFKRRLRSHQEIRYDSRSLALGAGIVVLGVLPPLALVFIHSAHGAGGAWIPAPGDWLVLFLLWTTGLMPVREYFLDSVNLVLPSLAFVSKVVWTAIGAMTCGIPVMWGMYKAWKRKNSYQTEVILAIVLIVLPIALIYSGSVITSQHLWALKPFLGSAYLFYIWAGIGIGTIKLPILKISLCIAIILVAMLSLWPYYTSWNKSTAARAFRSLPSLTDQDGVIIEPEYLSPVVFYYLPYTIPGYSIRVERGNEASIFRLLPSNNEINGHRLRVTCEELSSTSNLFMYGNNDRIREAIKSWPECIVDKKLWIFQQNHWQPLIR